MADPVSWLAIGSSLLSAGGQIYSGMEANAAAGANAQAAEADAVEAGRAAAYDEAVLRNRARREAGEELVALGANGVALTGSAKDLTLDNAVARELDILQRRRQGQMEARGYRNEAKRTRAEGKAAQVGSYIGAATSLLSGGSEFFRNQGGG